MRIHLQSLWATLVVIALFLFIPFQGNANGPAWDWVLQSGGNNWNSGKELITDEEGNLYVTGFFQGTSTFGDHVVISAGGFDMFVVKYNPQGEALWARSLGSVGLDYGVSIDADVTGNVFVAGYFSAVMDTEVGQITPIGWRDMFVAKYDANGTLMWVRNGGGPTINQGEGVAVDHTLGRVYVTGSYKGTMIFPGSDITLEGVANNDGIFVAAYNFDGDLLWAKSGTGTGNNRSFEIGTDADGNIYGGGFIEGTASFGNISATATGLSSIVIFKLDPDGNWLWVNTYGGSLGETIWDMEVKENGDTWFTGIFGSPIISFGDYTLYSDGMYYSVFVARQNADGEIIWAASGGGASHDYGRGVAVDKQGNSYITGNFHLTATFGEHSVTAGDNTDVFIVKYSPQGEALFALRAGGISTDIGDAITTDGMGNVYLTGYFYNNINFGDIYLETISQQDIFIAKLVDMQDPVLVSVSGTVESDFYGTLQGVEVTIPQLELSVLSGEDGTFIFDDVEGGSDISLVFSHPEHFQHEINLTLETEDVDVGVVILTYSILPVTDVTAVGDSTIVIIHWENPSTDKNSTATLESFSAFRFSEEDIEQPDNWTLLQQDIHENSFTDTHWAELEPGFYGWAIVAIYSGGFEAIPALSNILEKEQDSDVGIHARNTFNLLVYPNPASDVVSIHADKNISSVLVYDSSGKLVLNVNDEISQSTTLNISSLPSGIYVIAVHSEGLITHHKIQVIK